MLALVGCTRAGWRRPLEAVEVFTADHRLLAVIPATLLAVWLSQELAATGARDSVRRALAAGVSGPPGPRPDGDGRRSSEDEGRRPLLRGRNGRRLRR